MNDVKGYRSPLIITFTTWKALFLREAVARLTSRRNAWVWLLLEPALQISFMLVLMTQLHVRTVGGIDTVVWLVVGLVFANLFKRTATQSQHAISANKALYTYRQVKPVDTVLVRAALEGFLMVVIGLILVAGTSFVGYDFIPNQSWILFAAFLNIWLLALGLGLIASIGVLMIPELEKIIGFANGPIYLLSGVVIPISAIPEPFQHWLMYNPIVHSIESARKAMSSYYHTSPDLNLFYTTEVALFSVFIGLSLHSRFVARVYKK